MATGTFTWNLDLDGEDDVEVSVEWEGYYERARGMGGAWENSSPAEGEMDIIGVFRADNGQEVKPTPTQESHLLEQAWEEYHDQN